MATEARPELHTLYYIYVSLIVLLILTAIGAKIPLSPWSTRCSPWVSLW